MRLALPLILFLLLSACPNVERQAEREAARRIAQHGEKQALRKADRELALKAEREAAEALKRRRLTPGPSDPDREKKRKKAAEDAFGFVKGMAEADAASNRAEPAGR